MNNSLMDRKRFHCKSQMNDEANADEKPKTQLYEYHTFKLEQVLFVLFTSSRFYAQGLAALESFALSLISN